ncbi:hypothetical protein M9435_002956 [Picochlorum sp. BPE23]|nr:hypothetical protein M9435_002956 [Picochlorum sp. BPE23]
MDPLGDLCLAAIEDVEQENVVVHGDIDDVSQKCHEGRKGTTANNSLVALYKDQCTKFEVPECCEHVRLLEEIPGELVMGSGICQTMSNIPGGAVIRFDSSCQCSPGQVAALFSTIAPPRDSPVMVIVDTIDVRDIPIPVMGLSEMIQNAVLWGPWWRLRCLVLHNCQLGIEHLNVLGNVDAVPCFWNLEYLDVSHNGLIGRDLSTGIFRDPTGFATPDMAFLVHLWRQAKLRFLNIEAIEISPHVLGCLLMVLAEYHVSKGELGCGVALHTGSRSTLESLILGTVSGFADELQGNFTDAIKKLAKCLPSLSYLKIEGLSQEVLLEIYTVWKGTSSAACDLLMEDDVLRQSSFEHMKLPAGHVLLSNKDVDTPRDMHEEPEQCLPQQILDDFGLNQILCENEGTEADKAPILQSSNQVDRYDLSNVGIRKPAKISGVQQDKERDTKMRRRETHRKAPGLYSGSDRHDVLPIQEIDVVSESDGPELHENTQEDGDSDDTGQEQNPRSLSEDVIAPAVSDHTFRLRDGMLDEDSRMGKIYRMDTRKKVVQIPNMADQRAAKRAFKLWDQCTENSWDRRRWDNPSKTQNDEPHILGQLNLLFDILDKYDLRIGFPFPLWRRGLGESAFEEPPPSETQRQSNLREEKSPRSVSCISIASESREESLNDQEEAGRNRAVSKVRPILLTDDDDGSGDEMQKEGVEERRAIDDPKGHGEKPSHSSPGKDKGREARRTRELNRLSAWSWDAKLDDHPPNESIYGPATGKRQRRQAVPDEMIQFNETEESQERAKKPESSDEEDVPLLYRMGVIPESQETVD